MMTTMMTRLQTERMDTRDPQMQGNPWSQVDTYERAPHKTSQRRLPALHKGRKPGTTSPRRQHCKEDPQPQASRGNSRGGYTSLDPCQSPRLATSWNKMVARSSSWRTCSRTRNLHRWLQEYVGVSRSCRKNPRSHLTRKRILPHAHGTCHEGSHLRKGLADPP